ncbi:MAG: L-threonylcarbamoyladenylate synthase [Candidatus Izemoplasmataceae bacterium]
MKTSIYTVDQMQNQLVKKHLAKILKEGGLVVFPTETVYGIGANALDPLAASKIYEVKGRPADNPLIVHIDNLHMLKALTLEINLQARKLIQAFWPGPLTLIFKKSDLVPNTITANLDTVAIRFPSHPAARQLIKLAKFPIAAPSANISGRPSSTLFKHVKEDLDGLVDIIIDGGKSTIGLESTVLDVTTEVPTILRPGSITKRMIESVLEHSITDASKTEVIDAPKSPGMKYTHYAPKGKIILVDGLKEEVIDYINKAITILDHEKTAVICAKEYVSAIKCKHIFDLGSIEDSEEIASNLFIALRTMDELGIEQIYTHSFKDEQLGQAIMNRLLKAAGYNIIRL